MEPGDDSVPPPPPPTERPVFPRSATARPPEHELRDRAKAAKLRHKAAKARVKANKLEDHAKILYEKAAEWERRADELDGVVRVPGQVPVNE
jgi:hypothetical protein